MMTEQQKVLMQLMGEVREICAEQKIPYALYGHTAWMAVSKGGFSDNGYAFQIMVRASDLGRLIRVLQEKDPAHRGVESLFNNPNLSRNLVRYVNLDTTLIDMDLENACEMQGSCIEIVPVYDVTVSKSLRALLRGHGILHGAFPVTVGQISEKRMKSLKLTEFLEQHFGAAFVAKRIAKLLNKPHQETDSYYIEDRNGHLQRIKKAGFESGQEILFEGLSLRVPSENRIHLKGVYGKDWKKKCKEDWRTSASILVFHDEKTGFSHYFRKENTEGVDLKAWMIRNQEYHIWYNRTFVYRESRAKRLFYTAKQTARRIDSFLYYKNLRKDLRAAAEEKDMDRLKELMTPYLDDTQLCFSRTGLGFYVNEELLSYACMIWKAEGQEAYAQQILGAIPAKLKAENLEAYLKERGVLA